MIDALIWLLGPMVRVLCQAKRRAVKVDIDDTTSALIQFEFGSTGYLGTQCAAPLTATLRVLGTGANAEARGDFTQLELQRAGGSAEKVSLPTIDTLRAELEAFADACAGGPRYPVRIEDAIHGVTVMEAMGRWAKCAAASGSTSRHKRASVLRATEES